MAELGMAFLNPIAEGQRIDAQPDEQAHVKALTRLTGAEADTAQYNLEGEKKTGAMMAQWMSAPGQKSPADMALMQSYAYDKAGLPAKAGDAMKTYTLMKEREDKAAQSQAEMQMKKVEFGMKVADKAASMLNIDPNGTDEEKQRQWTQATDAAKKIFGDKAPFWTSMPYSEGLAKSIHGMALTAYQQGELKLNEMRTSADVKNKADEERHRLVSEDLQRTRAVIAKQNADARGKTGKVVGSPTDRDKETATDILRSFPNLLDEGSADETVAVDDIASLAKAKIVTNPGVDYSTAVRQTIADKIKSGEFADVVKPPTKIAGFKIPFTGGGETKGYKPVETKPAETPAEKTAAAVHPEVGTVMKGYKFKGGDPANKDSWEKV
jgi:hypothetical protein